MKSWKKLSFWQKSPFKSCNHCHNDENSKVRCQQKAKFTSHRIWSNIFSGSSEFFPRLCLLTLLPALKWTGHTFQVFLAKAYLMIIGPIGYPQKHEIFLHFLIFLPLLCILLFLSLKAIFLFLLYLALREEFFISSVRSSYSHPDLLVIQHHPLFQITPGGPQHWTVTFWATTAI